MVAVRPLRFLRYQFDSAAQLRRHCTLVHGRVLLFFPDTWPMLPARARALVELCFAHSTQQASVPAVIHSVVPGGAWLELRALSAVAGLHLAAAAPQRAQRRLALDQLAWVSHAGAPVLACPVLDISRDGARVWGIPGRAPAVREPIRIRLPQAPTLAGTVAWARGREVGIAFAPESRTAARQLYSRVEQQWALARFASHNPACPCADGEAPLDPPWPSSPDLYGGAP